MPEYNMMRIGDRINRDWLGNIKNDLLAGTVVALALIPEAIAFSIIAGVDPKVGLYASFCIAVAIAFTGGRSGMISAATGAMALAMVSLVKNHGLDYLIAASILTGLLQILAGVFKLGALMRFVSRSVVTGFVNALAILIFLAQIPEFQQGNLIMVALVIIGLTIIYTMPRLTTAIPAPLVCIMILTAVSISLNLDLRTVGDMGDLPTALPVFQLPSVPLNLTTLLIILPYSLTLTAIGLLESLMTATIVDDLTDTPSDKNRECRGQGIANIIAGLFGGMAGCAMIGQSVINIKSGGRGRLSTLFAGLLLLFLILVLDDWVRQIPMAALVSVMIMVSIGTFNWSSLKALTTQPKSSSTVMISTVLVVVITHDLAMGVLVGVLMSALFFAHKISQFMTVSSTLSDDQNHRTYTVQGQVFFASATAFGASFDFNDVIRAVTIDVSAAHFWDLSAVGALDAVVLKFQRKATTVTVVGMTAASATVVDRLSRYDNLKLLINA